MSNVLRGLLGTEAYASQRFTAIRRRVFYQYPAGAAPLIGLLSVVNKDKPLNDPEFTIFEKRYVLRVDATAAANGGANGPFADDAGTALNTGADTTLSSTTNYRITVGSTQYFRQDNTIMVRVVQNHAQTASPDILFRVISVLSATVLQVRPLINGVKVGNDSGLNIGNQVAVIGSAYRQGSLGGSQAGYNLPVNVMNATQIWKTAMSFTRTEQKTGGIKFDESGLYRDRAKECALEHMVDIERSLLFGDFSKDVDATSGLPLYTTRGIQGFLQLWESGSTYGNSAATLNTDDNKRIININGGISYKSYLTYLERVFRVTSNTANEKFVMCGNGFLMQLNEMYEGRSVTQVQMPNKATQFGQDIVGHKTEFGTVWYKTHPLFNADPQLRYDGLFLDLPNILYRPLQDGDTTRICGIQPNDADYRTDQYLTEAGFEMRLPESNMWLRGVTSVNR